MECSKENKIQDYLGGHLNHVERSIIRDHLIVCQRCRQKLEEFKKIEVILNEPLYIEPPEVIERNVMKKIFFMAPNLSSVFVLIAASFLLLITGIYIYFDFANNSLIQAFKLTSYGLTNWIGYLIKFISSVFSAVYAVFKSISAFFEIVFKINVGVEAIGLMISGMFILLFYTMFRFVFKRIKGKI